MPHQGVKWVKNGASSIAQRSTKDCETTARLLRQRNPDLNSRPRIRRRCT